MCHDLFLLKSNLRNSSIKCLQHHEPNAALTTMSLTLTNNLQNASETTTGGLKRTSGQSENDSTPFTKSTQNNECNRQKWYMDAKINRPVSKNLENKFHCIKPDIFWQIMIQRIKKQYAVDYVPDISELVKIFVNTKSPRGLLWIHIWLPKSKMHFNSQATQSWNYNKPWQLFNGV